MMKVKPYILSILIALATGGLSALLTAGNMNIYDEIATPPFAPPSILFPIVWSILYVLMGFSAALIFTGRNISLEKRRNALSSYAISLILNFFWSIIFFNLGSFFFAFLWILALLVFVIKTILEYKEINIIASVLQIPYLVWTLFATYLSAGIWILN